MTLSMVLNQRMSLFLLIAGLFFFLGDAFTIPETPGIAVSPTRVCMIGGRGWDNNDYLGALSGDDEERKKSSEDYQDYSERRKAFEERQQELMKSPQARAFMERRQNSMPMSDFENDGFQDPFAEIQPGSGGGSRMANMMTQAKQKQRGMGGMGGMGQNLGMEQKFFNFDDDDEEN